MVFNCKYNRIRLLRGLLKGKETEVLSNYHGRTSSPAGWYPIVLEIRKESGSMIAKDKKERLHSTFDIGYSVLNTPIKNKAILINSKFDD
jgi:hypothetical protein